MAIQSLKGFKDILPGETEKWAFIEQTARKLFQIYCYSEIKTPILEKTELFARAIGTYTDIVEKEMYTFEDRNNEWVTMRPEATASVLRAFLEHHLETRQPIQRLFSIGPMFRHERPQKGRLRQFHQINAECIGSPSPYMDAEAIFLLVQILSELGLTNFRLHLNSLGCPVCRPSYSSAMLDFLEDKKWLLCPDCQRRMETNPLRVLDCKVERCQEELAQAPTILSFNCAGCQSHFQMVQDLIAPLSIEFVVDPRLVRGLDYYCRTTFEVTARHLGSQDAVAGGGRYDGLLREMGGPDLPAIGFAIGLERVALLLPFQERWNRPPLVYLAPLGREAQTKAYDLLRRLHKKEIPALMEYEDKSLKSLLRRADKIGSPYVAILGSEELRKDSILIRDLNRQTQEEIPLSRFMDYFLERSTF
jgi:histidyl-tRNA synthetase